MKNRIAATPTASNKNVRIPRSAAHVFFLKARAISVLRKRHTSRKWPLEHSDRGWRPTSSADVILSIYRRLDTYGWTLIV
jgi:hypothetical protein